MSKASALAEAIGAISDRVLGDWEGNPAALRMKAETKRLAAGAAALVNAQRSRSPLDTPEAHVKKIGGMARKFDQEVLAMLNRNGATWGQGMADIDRRIAEKINLQPDSFAGEIRATYRAMKGPDRIAMIGKMIKENRGPELAALIKAPESLTGLSEADRTNYESAILSAHAPEELEERARLADSFEAAHAALRAATDLAKSLTDPHQLARIEREDEASRAAGVSFDEALSQP